MEDFDPDTYCGIYCSACSIATYGRTGRIDGFAACLGSVPKGELVCSGCKSDQVYAGCRVCMFRGCVAEKGVAHCVECADYPCSMYKRWQGAASILPHVGEASSSLDTIGRDGLEAWLEAQRKRWSCPDCGEPFSWYAAQCGNCGHSLTDIAFELKGWRKFLCRIILPLGYRKGKSKQTAA